MLQRNVHSIRMRAEREATPFFGIERRSVMSSLI